MNIKQSASTLVILAAVALVGAGCLSSSKDETRPVTTIRPTLDVPPEVLGQDVPSTDTQETTTVFATGPDGSVTINVSGDTTTVQDGVSGLSFTVPTALGEINTQNENGFGMEGAKSGDGGSADCLVQRAFLAGDTIFLTTYDTWQCDQLGRGGYWGDQARAFSTEADVKKWCDTKDSCVPYINPNGVTIYHAYSKSVDSWGDELTDIDMYAAWNPNKDIHGILISNQGFVQAGLGRMQDEVSAVADSLSFLE